MRESGRHRLTLRARWRPRHGAPGGELTVPRHREHGGQPQAREHDADVDRGDAGPYTDHMATMGLLPDTRPMDLMSDGGRLLSVTASAIEPAGARWDMVRTGGRRCRV